EHRPEVGNAACSFDRSQKTDPGHGIQDSRLNQILRLVGKRRRGIDLAAKTRLNNATKGIFSLQRRGLAQRHQNSSSQSAFGMGKRVSSMSQQTSRYGRVRPIRTKRCGQDMILYWN